MTPFVPPFDPFWLQGWTAAAQQVCVFAGVRLDAQADVSE